MWYVRVQNFFPEARKEGKFDLKFREPWPPHGLPLAFLVAHYLAFRYARLFCSDRRRCGGSFALFSVLLFTSLPNWAAIYGHSRPHQRSQPGPPLHSSQPRGCFTFWATVSYFYISLVRFLYSPHKIPRFSPRSLNVHKRNSKSQYMTTFYRTHYSLNLKSSFTYKVFVRNLQISSFFSCKTAQKVL